MSTEDKILAGLRLSYLGFVFQTFNLIGSLTAVENVELPMILKVKKIQNFTFILFFFYFSAEKIFLHVFILVNSTKNMF